MAFLERLKIYGKKIIELNSANLRSKILFFFFSFLEEEEIETKSSGRNSRMNTDYVPKNVPFFLLLVNFFLKSSKEMHNSYNDTLSYVKQRIVAFIDRKWTDQYWLCKIKTVLGGLLMEAHGLSFYFKSC